MTKKFGWLVLLTLLTCGALYAKTYFDKNNRYTFGQAIDSLNGVTIYYNGNTNTINGRTVVDGYNIGLKYQCVEFVKRYYFEHYHHRMPNAYGHAKSFFDAQYKDGQKNISRDLWQYTNPSASRPQVGDLVVMGGGKFGHVAIVSDVKTDEIEIIQQNPGRFSDSRIWINLYSTEEGLWFIDKHSIVGWLRK